eukprot:11029370-Karenia_brevis.AAC.1
MRSGLLGPDIPSALGHEGTSGDWRPLSAAQTPRLFLAAPIRQCANKVSNICALVANQLGGH